MKDVQLSPRIDEHDRDFKVERARGFLTEGHPVRLVVRFLGRDMRHPEVGMKALQDALEVLGNRSPSTSFSSPAWRAGSSSPSSTSPRGPSSPEKGAPERANGVAEQSDPSPAASAPVGAAEAGGDADRVPVAVSEPVPAGLPDPGPAGTPQRSMTSGPNPSPPGNALGPGPPLCAACTASPATPSSVPQRSPGPWGRLAISAGRHAGGAGAPGGAQWLYRVSEGDPAWWLLNETPPAVAAAAPPPSPGGAC